MSELLVNTIKKADGTGSLSVPAESGTVVTTASPSLGRRNLIINGAMQVAQRGTSSTVNTGYNTLDRFAAESSGGTITQEQASLTSGAPYTAGFRNSLKLTVTSAGSDSASNFCYINHYIEAQNLANSGWDYTSSSSYVTIQFWVRSSVAGTYYCVLRTLDGTNQGYVIPVTLSADTWTKVTQAVSGDSGIQVDNNNGAGLEVSIRPFVGTNYSDPSVSTNTWYVRSGTTQTPDYAHSWQQTSSATFEMTGLQLEVGSVATPFEHRSYGEELALCQRYYHLIANGITLPVCNGRYYTSGNVGGFYHAPVPMRATPTLDQTTGTSYYNSYTAGNGGDGLSSLRLAWNSISSPNTVFLENVTEANGTAGYGTIIGTNNASSYLALDSEL